MEVCSKIGRCITDVCPEKELTFMMGQTIAMCTRGISLLETIETMEA